jgi:membrane-bound metal-dependent hydrolase YbcI (DUF457 family)
MFVGHYGVSLALRPKAKDVSLGWLFLAAQWLDVIWAVLVLGGIEKLRVAPGFLPASSFDLYYMPFTHSLVAALFWSALAILAFRIAKYPLVSSLIVGITVFSHWVLDFVAHGPDLPLLTYAHTVGLGLWRFRLATFLTEALLLIVGLAIYLKFSKARNRLGTWGMPVYVFLLVVINIWNLYGAPPDPNSIPTLVVSAEVAYLLFALIAGWLDRTRTFDHETSA